METSFKSITNIQRWRRTAIALGSALAMSLAVPAFAMGTAPSITSSGTPPAGIVGVAFSYTITATGNPAPTYARSPIPPAPGLTGFNATTGVISGIPTTAGTFSATMTATNSNGVDTKPLTITINPPPTPTPTPSITSGNATGTVGTAFTYNITATNSPTSYGATGLPPGVTLKTPPPSSNLGLISGTPTTAGTYTVHLSATNGGGTGTKDVTFKIVDPPPTVTSAGTASGTWGQPFSYQITANQTIPSGGWGSTVTAIAGVTFDPATGLFSGTPTALGTFSGNITATNTNGTGTKALTVTINPATHTAPTSSFTMLPTAVWAGDTVTLNGSASHTNPDDGSPLIYTWQQQAPPVGTLAISLSPEPPKEVM